MTYVIARNGTVVRYPYSFAQLCQDHPEVSFPRDPSDALLAEFGMLPVADATKPEPSDPLTRRVVERVPALVESLWVRSWVEEAISAEEILAREKSETDDAHHQTVKADPFVASFLAMSPAEVVAYVDTNVTNLASAKVVIAKLAQMMLLLARREFR